MNPKYISVKAFAQLGAYSEQAIRSKIKKGHWVLNQHYRKSPDGRILLDFEQINLWIESAS